MSKMHVISRIIGLTLLTSIIGCSEQKSRLSDAKITENFAFEKLDIKVKNENEIILNVAELKRFNYCHIILDSGVYATYHTEADSLLIINDKNVVQMDTVGKSFRPFTRGSSFSLIMGNKANKDTFDLSMAGTFGLDITIEEVGSD